MRGRCLCGSIHLRSTASSCATLPAGRSRYLHFDNVFLARHSRTPLRSAKEKANCIVVLLYWHTNRCCETGQTVEDDHIVSIDGQHGGRIMRQRRPLGFHPGIC
jgi:hypothetical protein